MTEFIILWTAVIIISVIVEAVTAQMVSIWFAIGGIASLICTLFECEFYIQVIVFLIVSGLALLLFWVLKNKFRRSSPPESTNFDRILGKEAIVVQKINNITGIGQINIYGQIWTARSIDDESIEEGTPVKIMKIEGVKAVVKVI